MRVSLPISTARIGQIEIRGVQRVVEFEARDHQSNRTLRPGQQSTQAVSQDHIDVIQSRTAIVVPCKNEPLCRIMSVWAGIPASSLIISVSASAQDAYASERDALSQFCRDTGRNGISVHQRDHKLAKALRDIGMTALLNDDGGLVHGGKGEALVIGIALAATAPGPAGVADPLGQARAHNECHGRNKNRERNGRVEGQETNMQRGDGCPHDINGNTQHCGGTGEVTDNGTCRHNQYCGYAAKSQGRTSYYRYIGFIDADNFVTGSVSEYCKAFSAGFHLASAEDAMVRINWGSKPKVQDGQLVFKTSGRSSEVVNRYFNEFLGNMESRGGCVISGDAYRRAESEKGGMELHHICTGNAGEHAMTLSLALKLRLASGYAIEPFHFLDLIERFAGEQTLEPSPAPDDFGLPANPLPDLHSTMSSVSGSLFSNPCDTPRFSSPVSEGSISTALTSLPGLSLHATAAVDLEVLSQEATTASPRVQVLQIQTMNPHFHDTSKGESHITRMWTQGLSAIYHSPVTANLPEFRQGLWDAILAGKVKTDSIKNHDLFPPSPPFTTHASCSTSPRTGEGVVQAGANWEPPQCRIYPAPAGFDLFRLWDMLLQESPSFWWSGSQEEGQDDEEQHLDWDAENDSASRVGRNHPGQERQPQYSSKRDSGVDFGMDGADQARSMSGMVTDSDLHVPLDISRLGLIANSNVTGDKKSTAVNKESVDIITSVVGSGVDTTQGQHRQRRQHLQPSGSRSLRRKMLGIFQAVGGMQARQ